MSHLHGGQAAPRAVQCTVVSANEALLRCVVAVAVAPPLHQHPDVAWLQATALEAVDLLQCLHDLVKVEVTVRGHHTGSDAAWKKATALEAVDLLQCLHGYCRELSILLKWGSYTPTHQLNLHVAQVQDDSPRAAAAHTVWATLRLASYGGLGNSVGRFRHKGIREPRDYTCTESVLCPNPTLLMAEA